MTRFQLQKHNCEDITSFFGNIMNMVCENNTRAASQLITELSLKDKMTFDNWLNTNGGELYSYKFVEKAWGLLDELN